MYNCLLNLFNSGVYISPWVLQVKQIVDDRGLSYLWLSQECGNTDRLKLTVERTLKDQFVQNWSKSLMVLHHVTSM